MAAQRLSRRQKRILQWLAADHQRTRGMITSSHQDLVRALPGDKGNMSHKQPPRSARRNALPVKLIDGPLLMSHQYLACALV